VRADNYASGRCCAVRADNGRRCGGRWALAVPCTFAWDPVNGVGIDGPWAVFCWRHRRVYYRRHDRNKMERIRVTGGWLGPANEYGYGSCVFRSKTSWKPAPRWWALRTPSEFGQRHRTDSL
jgi:hypothetical protein